MCLSSMLCRWPTLSFFHLCFICTLTIPISQLSYLCTYEILEKPVKMINAVFDPSGRSRPHGAFLIEDVHFFLANSVVRSVGRLSVEIRMKMSNGLSTSHSVSSSPARFALHLFTRFETGNTFEKTRRLDVN